MNFKSLIIYNIVITLIFVLFYRCTDNNEITSHNWKLVWSDEFDNTKVGSLPDSTKWTYDLGNGTNGWGNSEWETYTKSTKNVVVDSVDGIKCLKIIARYENSTYTSARIKTKGKFDQMFGRFEARMKMPWGPGLWPAFWMLGSNDTAASWPKCGEIDIMEYKGQQPNLVHGTIHGPGYSAGNAITTTYGLGNVRFDTDYHIFAIEWTTEGIDFYVDNTLYKRIIPEDVSGKGDWVFNHPFYLILNLAVCGNFVGFTTTGTVFPQTLYVDYVRVYKQVD